MATEEFPPKIIDAAFPMNARVALPFTEQRMLEHEVSEKSRHRLILSFEIVQARDYER